MKGAHRARAWVIVIPPALLLVAAVGCQSTGRLAEYDFAGGTLYVSYVFPPRPEILTGPYFPGHPRDPVHAIIRIGGNLARELAASGARERLDAACQVVAISERIADRASGRAARYLRVDLVEDEGDADYGLEVRIRDYGIDAEEWESAAHFFIDAEVILYDVVDGSEIWESHVRERDPIAPHVFGGRRAALIRDMITAAALSGLSEEDMIVALEALADYAGDRISEKLRDSLEEVRGR
ncbi:MAG: hypothetical protein HKO53_20015 [Gemmatimonadetes bacterium]|nr:hypothetical protein [Gemmatimonadota bacterium]